MAKTLVAAISTLIWAILVVGLAVGPGSGEEFPSRPITVVVHSRPGSGIDLMSRKVADIARGLVDQPLVVENRPGSQGIVAMQHVLDAEADGYTLLAVTRSFLSTVLVSHSTLSMDDFAFVARLMDDPEALIVHAEAPVHDLSSLLADAADGDQVWIGPGTGGRDHLMALKTWGVLGIDARWLDYKAGPKAVLAMLRQEAPVYVGNPGDVLGKPELRVAAIAAPTRLEGLPDVPTLQEHGYPLVESMWRGFALRRGVPDERVDFLSDVLRQVAEHPEWEAFCTSRHVFPAYAGPEEFTAQVEAEAAETRQLLAQAGLLEDYLAPGPLPPWLVAVALAVALVMAWIAVDRLRPEAARLDLAMGAGFCWVAGVFAWEAGRFTLPADVHDVTHPAVVPGLWIALIGALGLVLMFRAGRSVADPVTDGGRAGPPLVVVGCTLALVGAVQVVGYLAAAAPFLYGVAWILGSRDWRSTTTFATAFASLSFVVFRWVLAIELPAGALLGG